MGKIAYICEECSKKKREMYDQHFRRNTYDVGFAVVVPMKSARTFKDDENKDRHIVENMWLEIKEQNGDNYKGVLLHNAHNTDFYDIEEGSVIEFNKSEIIDDQEANLVELFAGRHVHN